MKKLMTFHSFPPPLRLGCSHIAGSQLKHAKNVNNLKDDSAR